MICDTAPLAEKNLMLITLVFAARSNPLVGSSWHEEFCSKVKNLDATEDGESCEEPHGAADEADLSGYSHLDIPLYLVIGGRVKVDLDQLQGSILYGRVWAGNNWVFVNKYQILLRPLSLESNTMFWAKSVLYCLYCSTSLSTASLSSPPRPPLNLTYFPPVNFLFNQI